MAGVREAGVADTSAPVTCRKEPTMNSSSRGWYIKCPAQNGDAMPPVRSFLSLSMTWFQSIAAPLPSAGKSIKWGLCSMWYARKPCGMPVIAVPDLTKRVRRMLTTCWICLGGFPPSGVAVYPVAR